MRWRVVVSVLLVGCVAIMGNGLRQDKTPFASPAHASPRHPADRDRLVVHEWGTFTSYSGSDGLRLEFRPLVDSDLPPFVLDRALQSGLYHPAVYRAKFRLQALVRMETPVTYFYTDQPRQVHVRVGFPQGLLTEFYPPVDSLAPAFDPRQSEVMSNSLLDWGTVNLIPQAMFRPQLADADLARSIEGHVVRSLPPSAESSPYRFARETDSAIVHVRRPKDKQRPFAPDGDYFEKFLFYRGLGNFALPLEARALGNGGIQLTNRDTDAIAWLLALEVRGDEVRYAALNGLPAGEVRDLSLPETDGDQQQMLEQLTAALVRQGLYQREAEAMVNTWRDSWFGEQGMRVLYLVPQQITDEMLPLEIDPRPDELVRVLVGRLDIMSPEQEAKIAALVRRSAAARARREAEARQSGTALEYPLPDEIQQMGRLAEPALARVRGLANEPQIRDEATRLLAQLVVREQSQE